MPIKMKKIALPLLFVFLAGCQKSPEEIDKAGGIHVRNNFVTDLLEITSITKPYAEYSFSNPRNGWIFISSTANDAGLDRVMLAIDSNSVEDAVIVHEAGTERTLDAMRRLSAGKHKVNVWCEKGSSLENLTIRAIPELIFCHFGSNPSVSEYGPYDTKFLEKYIFNNVNTLVVGASNSLPTSVTQPWKKQGKKWIGSCGIPGMWNRSEAPQAYDDWTKLYKQNPYLDGLIADEFVPSHGFQENYIPWTGAVKKMYSEEEFRGKIFHAWVYSDLFNSQDVGNMWDSQPSRSFIQTLMDCDYRIAWMTYYFEEPTEEAAKESLESFLKQRMLAWRNAQPGIEKHLIPCLCLLSTIPITVNINPSVDFKVFMDMQVNMIANDPAFSGIGGLMWFTSSYADEETVRWEGKLFRHYCIEGNTEMLSKDPYLLTHIMNPGFNENTKGWTIIPAEEGSTGVRSYKDYCRIQGRWYTIFSDVGTLKEFRYPTKGIEYRYPETVSDGDNFLWMRRSSKRPNIFFQEIRNLEPGRLYSLKMYTTDYKDLIEGKSDEKKHGVNIYIEGVELDANYKDLIEGKSDEKKHGVSINIEGTETDADKHIQHLFASRQYIKGIWMNYHWMVFRAKSTSAKLIVSDWESEKKPGGPIGQELIYNFIEVQPYVED